MGTAWLSHEKIMALLYSYRLDGFFLFVFVLVTKETSGLAAPDCDKVTSP